MHQHKKCIINNTTFAIKKHTCNDFNINTDEFLGIVLCTKRKNLHPPSWPIKIYIIIIINIIIII